MPREVTYDAGEGVIAQSNVGASGVIEKYGVGGNAELLIALVRESTPRELTAASAKRENAELAKHGLATLREKPTRDEVAEVADIPSGRIRDVEVRGESSVVYAAEDDTGVIYKGTYDLDDPEDSHVSQLEPIDPDSPVGRELKRRAAAAQPAVDSDATRARERALAKREKEVAAKEREAAERLRDAEARIASLDAAQGDRSDVEAAELEGSSGEPDGGTPAPPDALPADYDDLNAKDAAKAVNALEGDDKAAAIDYERATKGRKSITGDD